MSNITESEDIQELLEVKNSDGKGIAETMFNLYRNTETDLLNLGHLFTVIEQTGVRRTDPRLAEFLTRVVKHHEIYGEENTTINNLNVDETTFCRLTENNLVLLSQIIRNDVIIPDWPGFTKEVRTIFNACKDNRDGNVASYIPQLARYHPDLWGVSICTIDGQRFSLGDVNEPFTIQSCSKPFTYAICLSELGNDVVNKYIGQEPSGRNFNDLCLDPTNRPHNPMLNAGAIMSSALILEKINPQLGLADKYDFLLNYMKQLAGGEGIGFNNSVFLSERESADRNFAMAYYMRENRSFPEGIDIQECLDLYFQACSLEVTAESLAVMGATFANGGICPTTGDKVLKPCAVRDVLSLMYSCGMYNYSGQFAFKVGLPAKSGVSGCVLLVIPNMMSIALWSPPLDHIGNSVRSLQFCDELVQIFNFHRFDNLRNLSTQKIDPRREPHELRSLTTLTLLFSAVAGDVSSLHRHYLQGVDMTICDYDGRTALHLAAAEGQEAAVKFLLETCGVPPNPKDRWGHTPQEEANRFGHEGVIHFFRKYVKV
jgi:glutaminase